MGIYRRFEKSSHIIIAYKYSFTLVYFKRRETCKSLVNHCISYNKLRKWVISVFLLLLSHESFLVCLELTQNGL